jgi:hypothetical protein
VHRMAAPAPVPGFTAAPVNTSTQLAALRTDVLGSPTAAAAAAATGSRTPGSSAKARQLVYLGQLYGAEVVGRKCAVLHNRHGRQGFEKALILDFDPQSGERGPFQPLVNHYSCHMSCQFHVLLSRRSKTDMLTSS